MRASAVAAKSADSTGRRDGATGGMPRTRSARRYNGSMIPDRVLAARARAPCARAGAARGAHATARRRRRERGLVRRRALRPSCRGCVTCLTCVSEAHRLRRRDRPANRRARAALDRVARSLSAEGLLTAWRDERYAVAAEFGAPPWFLLERAAARYFGVHTYAVHVNGLVRRGDETLMWIARRSPTKAIDPGMLDNLVGGGIAHGQSIASTVVKEAWEEAGIPPDAAVTASPAGEVRVCRELADGLERETIFVYDLLLSARFHSRVPGRRSRRAQARDVGRRRRAHRERNRARRRHRQCKSRDPRLPAAARRDRARCAARAVNWKRCGTRQAGAICAFDPLTRARAGVAYCSNRPTARRRRWLMP